MSYKPLKEMTTDELRREVAVWDRAVRESQVAEWVDRADQWRHKALAEMSRRERAQQAAMAEGG